MPEPEQVWRIVTPTGFPNMLVCLTANMFNAKLTALAVAPMSARTPGASPCTTSSTVSTYTRLVGAPSRSLASTTSSTSLRSRSTCSKSGSYMTGALCSAAQPRAMFFSGKWTVAKSCRSSRMVVRCDLVPEMYVWLSVCDPSRCYHTSHKRTFACMMTTHNFLRLIGAECRPLNIRITHISLPGRPRRGRRRTSRFGGLEFVGRRITPSTVAWTN